MLFAKDPLDVLLERLRSLPPADRRAIMQRLLPTERRQVEAVLDTPIAIAVPRFASDIMARIAADADDTVMTPATREVLLQTAGAVVPVDVTRQGPSLFARLGDALRWR